MKSLIIALVALALIHRVRAAEHPYMIVRASEHAELQTLAARSPWKEMKAAAIGTSNGTTINASAGVRERAFNLNKIMDSTALAYILDPANRDKYRDRIYAYLKYWDLAQTGNITKDLTDDTWDGSVAPGAALFFTIVAMDIVYHDPNTTPAQLAQRDGLVTLLDRPGGAGTMGPGRFYYDTPFEFHLTAHRAAKGIWAMWKEDAAALASAKAEYRAAWRDFITDDGAYREYSGYALARSGEPSRSHKHFFGDVLVYTGADPTWYATPKLQKFYEWLGGYALMPNRWTWPIGDSSYTSYSGNYNSNFDVAHRFSAAAARYGKWANNGAIPSGKLFPYILLPRTDVPVAEEAPSRIFADGGAWLKQPGGGREGLAAVLVNQTYTATSGLGHIHKEQNSLHLAALGELLLRGSGYNGWDSSDAIGGGFSFAYSNNHAVSSNVALFNYSIGNEKDPSFTNDHRKLGGLGVAGLLSTGLDYAIGDTGPAGLPTSSIPNGRHVRHTVAVYPQDGVNAYVHCMDELAGTSATTSAHLAWHPHADTITVNAGNAGDQEYEFKIKQTVNTADQLYLSIYQATAPSAQQQYNGLFGEDISGAQPYRTFVGRYLFQTYALDPATKRRNVLTTFFPRKSAQAKPSMERLAATAAGAPDSRAAVFTFAGGVRDFALESDGAAERAVTSPTADPVGAVARAKFAVYRKITSGAAASLAFYFVAGGRAFKNTPTGFTHGFASDAEVDLHMRGAAGTVVSPGTAVTFYHPGFSQVKIDDALAPALASGDGFVRVNVPAGTHRLQLEAGVPMPVFLRQPADKTVIAGAPLLLGAEVAGATYQWFRDGVALAGETAASLYRATADATDAGVYTVRATNALGTVTSAVATVALDADASRLINASCRTQLAPGATLIPGFSLAGTGRKTVLIRAVGPKLADFGLGGVLADPQIKVYRGTTVIAQSNDWDAAQIGDAFTRTGAFPLPAGSKDAALVVTLDAPGGYSVHVNGADGGGGVVLMELYDADPVGAPRPARLGNVSVRGQAADGDATLILGFVLAGRGERPLLLRGGGPALAGFGVAGTLADPRLEVFDGAGRSLVFNNDWGSATYLAQQEQVRSLVGAFPYVAGSRDAAALTTLSPAAYTVKITGPAATSGEALVEIYEAP